MGIIDRLRNRSTTPTEVLSLGMTLPDFAYGKPTWPSWSPEWASSQGYRNMALIYRLVNILAHALGTAPVRILDENLNGETVKAHPVSELMRRPNPQMGSASFWSLVGVRVSTSGFCVIEKERALAGNTLALWPLVSAWCQAIPRKNAPPDWRYRPGGKGDGYILKADDVIAFTYADGPGGSPYGIGPLEVCMREIGISTKLTDFLKNFIESGMVPIYGAIPDVWPGQTLKQADIDRLDGQFMGRHGGADKAHRMAWLTGVKDIKRLGLDMNELAYQELRDVTELSIIQAFGIPASVAQIRVGLEHSDSRANAETDEMKLYRQTIIPLWARFDDRLTIDLLPEFDSRPNISLEFDTSDIAALQESRDTKAAWLNTAVAGGWLSAHAWHRELGLPLPVGDDYYLRSLAVDVIPIKDPLALGEKSKLPVVTPADSVDPSAPAALGAGSRYASPQTREINGRIFTVFARETPADESYMIRFAKAGADKALIQRVALNRRKSFEAFFSAQGKRLIPGVISKLESGSGPTELFAVSGLGASEDKAIQSVAKQLYMLAGKTAFKAADDLHGISLDIAFDLKNPQVKNVVDKLAKKVVRVNTETKSQIEAKVKEGLDAGMRPDEIAGTLRGMFEEEYKNRALTIARTESMHAYGEANVLAFTKSGIVDQVEIFDNPEHDEDYGAEDGETCASRDGLICPLDEGMDHIYADHPNGSAAMVPVIGDAEE